MHAHHCSPKHAGPSFRSTPAIPTNLGSGYRKVYMQEFIRRAIRSTSAKNALLSCRPDEIVELMQCVQEMLSCPRRSGHFKPHLCRLLLAMSKTTSILPPSLFLRGVDCEDKNAVAGGAYSDIFCASYGGSKVALKRLRIFRDGTQQREKECAAFCREALLWCHLQHSFILPCLGVDCVIFGYSLCLVSPWMQNGNIMSCMKRFEDIGEPLYTERWVAEIAEGLAYLHKERIVHGDLRGANILMDDALSVKLADFGLAQFVDASSGSMGSTSGGAVRWLAPEVIKGSRSSFASDVYAFGCTCLEIYTRRPPFPGIHNDAQVVARLLQGDLPTKPDLDIPHGPWDLAARCWDADPLCRPDMDTIKRILRREYEQPTTSESSVHVTPGDSFHSEAAWNANISNLFPGAQLSNSLNPWYRTEWQIPSILEPQNSIYVYPLPRMDIPRRSRPVELLTWGTEETLSQQCQSALHKLHNAPYLSR